jgi:hypothetical protein
MNVVFFPVYVNVTHFLCVGCFCSFSFGWHDFVVLLRRNCCTKCYGWCLLVGIRLLVSHMCSVCCVFMLCGVIRSVWH